MRIVIIALNVKKKKEFSGAIVSSAAAQCPKVDFSVEEHVSPPAGLTGALPPDDVT